MKQYLKSVSSQATAIIIAAAGAALITFLQSIVASTGACDPIPVKPEEAGALGAMFKGTHSAFTVAKTKILL